MRGPRACPRELKRAIEARASITWYQRRFALSGGAPAHVHGLVGTDPRSLGTASPTSVTLAFGNLSSV